MKNLKKISSKYSSLIIETDNKIRLLLQNLNTEELAKHNYSYASFKTNPFKIVENEKNRYIYLLNRIISNTKGNIICDVGTFIPYLPLALKSLGFKVKIIDNYQFYDPSFKEALFKMTEKEGIELIDLDILSSNFKHLEKSNVILLTAVVEHLNGSPKTLLSNLQNLMAENASIFFEIPNITELKRRLAMMLGRSPLPLYHDYFHSNYPYIGHNREMTIEEVQLLFQYSNFKINYLDCYDYYFDKSNVNDWIIKSIKTILPIKDFNQCIFVQASL